MGWTKSIVTRYKQQCSTSDHHQDKELQTRYYKITQDKALTEVEGIFSDKQRYEIKSISREHGEILLEAKKHAITIVVSVVPIRNFENAIDFYVSTDKWRPTGAYPQLKQEVIEAYNRLGKKITAVESSK